MEYRYGYNREGEIVITAAYIDDPNERKTYCGYAMRSLKDAEDREKGERIALGRAQAAQRKGTRTPWSEQNKRRTRELVGTAWSHMCYVADHISGFRCAYLEKLRPQQHHIDAELYWALRDGHIQMYHDHIEVFDTKGKTWNLKLS